MLVRLAAVFVSVGLLGSAVASSFATPPPLSSESVAPPADDARMPVRAAPDRAVVRKALEKRRAKNLAAFRAYAKAGVYPHNLFRAGPLNVWIDAEGHLCAAATMISKDGKDALVKKIGETDNNIRLLNVVQGPLLDWMMTSGFTIEEIDRIQAPAIYPDDMMKTADALRIEDEKLAAHYKATATHLVKHAKSSLDIATDRLMKMPSLAWQLVDGTL